MANTTQVQQPSMALGDGAKFNAAGQSLNGQAAEDVLNLRNPGPGVSVSANYNNQYIPPPAVVSSANAATKTQENLGTMNNLQTTMGNNQVNKAAADAAAAGNPPATDTSTPQTGNSGVVATTNPDGTLSYNAKDPNDFNAVAYAQMQNGLSTFNAQAKNLQSQMDSIRNGSYVLTPAEQGQIDAIKQSVDRQVANQQQINNTELANLNMAGIRSGRERYTTESNDSSLADAQTKELQRITDIQNQGAALILQARQAIADKDWKMLNDTLSNYQKSYDNQSQGILNLLKINQDQEKAQQDKITNALNQQKADTDAFKAQQTFNKDNGVTAQFFQYPGSSQVFDSRTGERVTEQEYKAAGGKGGDYKDIQVLSNSPQLQSAAGKEYQDYLSTLPQGQKPMSFSDYQNADQNRKERIARAGASTITDDSKTFDLRVKQAPSQVANLKAQGYGWDQIAQYFNGLGIDPGNTEIDDALHRAFQSQGDYEKWKVGNYNVKNGLPR